MSMPTKGKHHQLTHPHHQAHHTHLPSQHIIGVNISQSTASSVSHSPHVHYNSTVLSNSSRFVSHSASDFHVSGQNFSAQSGAQVGGGGNSLGLPSARGPSLGGIQSIAQNTSTLTAGPTINQLQSGTGSNIQSQSTQNISSTTTILHNSSSLEMGKQQAHLQTQPPPIQPPVYVQNRSVSQQNYYASGTRPQQSRNISHRTAQSANQAQIVGIQGVGGSSGQHTTLYPHPSMTIQPSTVYVQNQVSGIHSNPHQQNVYLTNNQMPMQYSGTPQRHQTHQNQYSYQSYPPHTLLATAGLFGYSHGGQHPGFFYHQPPNTQLNLARANPSSINSAQHLSAPLTGSQAGTIVPTGNLQQATHQGQTIHAISIPTDVYAGLHGGSGIISARSKKPRTKAITDIVDPFTGKNISAEIYKDDLTMQSPESSTKENPHSLNSKAELAADFAARVAKLASESTTSISATDRESISISQIENNKSIYTTKTIDSKKTPMCNSETYPEHNAMPSPLEMEHNIHDSDNELSQQNILVEFHVEEVTASEIHKEQRDTQRHKEPTEMKCDLNVDLENPLTNIKYLDKEIEEIQNFGNVSLPLLDKVLDMDKTVNGEEYTKPLEIDLEKSDIHLKYLEGKNMQKQKNKNKVKIRELNRRGAEKEGTDMDAFIKNELKSGSISEKGIKKEDNLELTKDIKEKDNYESRKDIDVHEAYCHSFEKDTSTFDNNEKEMLILEEKISQKNFINKESSLEDPLRNISIEIDSVDHICSSRIENEILPSVVTQKNEENCKVSELSNTAKEEVPTELSKIKLLKSIPSLKYAYSHDQWSPINTNGKKVYGREFLMKLQNDPNSKIKPLNLPDLDVVLKDSTKIRSSVDLRFKDTNLGRHDSLFPGFAKSSLTSKAPPPSKKSHTVKLKQNKPNSIHLSLSVREDVKLRETENAWKPTRFVLVSDCEKQSKTEILYKKVRSVLNKLTPQKLHTLVSQVQELEIDTQERLQGVIDLVFEKAVDEPNFSKAYAEMCKALSNIQVTGADTTDTSSANFRRLIVTRCQAEFEKNTVDENARTEKLKEIEECTDQKKKKELLLLFEEEERRIRVKSVGNIRFVGELFKQNMINFNIMHQCIRHLLNQVDEESLECLCKLLTTVGGVLESKNPKGTESFLEYFKQMQNIANRKGKISSRIRFMLQDVIDLRANNWIPRRDDSNPKTMDQIQKEAEFERQEIQLNNTSLNTPRKDDRANERKRNRGGSGSTEEGGWSVQGRSRQVYSVETAKLKNKPPSMDDMQLGIRSTYQWSRPNPKTMTLNKFSCLENKTSETDKRVPNIHISGSRSMGPRDYSRVETKSSYDSRNSRSSSYQLSSTLPVKETSAIESTRSQSLSSMTSPKSCTTQNTVLHNASELFSEEAMQLELNKFLEEYIAGEKDIEDVSEEFRTLFHVSCHLSFVQETINAVLEKSDHHRNKTSQLLAHLLSYECISLLNFKHGLEKIFEAAADLIIDIPKLWKYFAKILVYPVLTNSYPLSELKTAIQYLPLQLQEDGCILELLAGILLEIKELEGVTKAASCWYESGLEWDNIVDSQEKVDKVLKEYDLDFLKMSSCTNITNESVSILNIPEIHQSLSKLLKDCSFDEIKNWIQEHLGDNVKAPKFIRALMTCVLETSVEQCNDKWTFKVENFDKSKKLIQRYVDADADLELQCLFALQAYIHRLEHPSGLIQRITNYLCENNLVSNEAFLAWENNDNPDERDGKDTAMFCLKSFFTPLKEAEISSGEETES